MAFIKSLYIDTKLLFVTLGIALIFLLSYWVHPLYQIGWVCALIFCIVVLADALLVFVVTNGITARRILPNRFSNSDHNQVSITVTNQYAFNIFIKVIDELPFQFQKRDFNHSATIQKNGHYDFIYEVKPVERGEYHYGKLNIYVNSPLQLIRRRYIFQDEVVVKVYPSFVQMQQYDFLAIDSKTSTYGLKKIRRIGHTMEFEQIKDYVVGDDIRTINWKATAKRASLMVNQYQDEKSQPIYSIIDTGRVMKMPFNELSLLDYAINATLAFSNVGLKKSDKVGLVTFNKNLDEFVPALGKLTHLNTLLEKLYNVNTLFPDSDFGNLYGHLNRKVNQRSLLFLYTNFEHISALRRQLPFLKAISKKHVLVVIFFENTELTNFIQEKSEDLQDVIHKTIAEKFVHDKTLMLKELQIHGIQGILTKPENLTINTINKYLEIKAKGLL
ncbi:DUF58 domain-containing protein [Neptunitalea lumnitzerae]|uniref:DUF58 domain-containing protein n=1 Tax=Neptunitalea lumnitzerae TaxID=2965509 RepID=UPI00248FF387|nr:DUF58 domain-containing protein [Neptunitalea sp. Y10]